MARTVMCGGCLRNQEGEILAYSPQCEVHGGYGAGRMMSGPILDPDDSNDELPGSAELRQALAEVEPWTPEHGPGTPDDRHTPKPVDADAGHVPFTPRPEGVTTVSFLVEVDTFGTMGDDRRMGDVARVVALGLQRAFGPSPDPQTNEPGQWRLWTGGDGSWGVDGSWRRVMFDNLAHDGEHPGHDVPILIVPEPH